MLKFSVRVQKFRTTISAFNVFTLTGWRFWKNQIYFDWYVKEQVTHDHGSFIPLDTIHVLPPAVKF